MSVALVDTLEALEATPVRGPRVLVLDGEPGDWLPARWAVIGRRGRNLGEYLANAFKDVGGPALVIGSETPQVTPALLGACVEVLRTPCVDAVLGPGINGGCWAVGLREPEPAVFLGVSSGGREILGPQPQRLRALGSRSQSCPRFAKWRRWRTRGRSRRKRALRGSHGRSHRCWSRRRRSVRSHEHGDRAHLQANGSTCNGNGTRRTTVGREEGARCRSLRPQRNDPPAPPANRDGGDRPRRGRRVRPVLVRPVEPVRRQAGR